MYPLFLKEKQVSGDILKWGKKEKGVERKRQPKCKGGV